MTARCAHQVQDYMGACYGGNLFVNDTANSSVCTPYALTNASARLFTCREVPSTYAVFCRPYWRVASAPNNYAEVWTQMDKVAKTRWSTFAAAGVSDECKEALRLFFCAEYFSPCTNQDSLINPIEDVLQPLCPRLEKDCPINMAHRVCSFDPYTPPDPRQCSA